MNTRLATTRLLKRKAAAEGRNRRIRLTAGMRRRGLAVAVLAAALFATLPVVSVLAQPGNITLASTADDGTKGNGTSWFPSLSADGTKVAFESFAINLDPADEDGLGNVYVKDLTTGDLVLASTADDGTVGNFESQQPALSADGTRVVFSSVATNLDPADTDFNEDIYVKDLTTGDLILASTSDSGDKSLNGNSHELPAISADGTRVAFKSFADDLDPADTDETCDVYVKDLTTGELVVASTADDGTKGNDCSINPSLSADGTRVAFISLATNLDPADTDELTFDVYVKDLTTGDLVLASTADDGTKGDGVSQFVSLSADGTRVAFFSSSTNLDPADTDDTNDVYAKDLTTGDIVLASTADDGAKGNGESILPSLSADGTRVAFSSLATNLDPLHASSLDPRDVYVKDLTTGDIVLASTADDGTRANGPSGEQRFSLSGDGTRVAFDSRATNLDPADTDDLDDVYVKELQVTGGVVINGDLVVTDCDDPLLAQVIEITGNLIIQDVAGCTAISLPNLHQLGGDGTITGNESATTIELGSLVSAGGGLLVTGNGNATVELGSLVSAGGGLLVESTGTGTFDGGDSPTITGNEMLDLSGYDAVSGATADGETTVENRRDDAVMSAMLPTGAFSSSADFTITRLDPAMLAAEDGFDAAGGPAMIDPVAAYQFMFAVPTLNSPATLTFDVVLAGLDAATQATVLDALSTGFITMATKGDAAGSMYQAFPICSGAEVPTPDGCVKVESLDAAGNPTTETPEIIRFSNVVGHFSTWAVALVEGADGDPPTVTCQAPAPLFLLGQVGASVSATVEDAGSGPLQATVSAPADTSSVGQKTVALTGSDVAGNETTVECSYLVTFVFFGFQPPVDGGGVLNVVKAGQAIPLKWRLTDASGAPVLDLASATISVQGLSCSSGTSEDLIEETVAGDSGLQNLGDGYYQLNWKSPKSYAGSCKTLRLDLGEGIYRTALFRFTG